MSRRVPGSVAELRRVCQEGSHGPAGQPWSFRQVRRVSIFLTWLLLHLPISPNGVTLLGIAAGIAASVLLGTTHFGAGVVVLQLAILLDFSDGEVSRFRKQQSKQGSYLDRVYHFTVHPCVFAGLTIGTFLVRPSIPVLVAGFVATISVSAFVMVMAYANELAVWKHARRLVDTLNASTHAVVSARAQSETAGTFHEGARRSRTARWLSEAAAFWEFPHIFWAITVAAVVQQFVPLLTVRGTTATPLEVVLLFYAVTYPGWIALYLTYVLATQATERGYQVFASDLSRLLSRARSRTGSESE